METFEFIQLKAACAGAMRHELVFTTNRFFLFTIDVAVKVLDSELPVETPGFSIRVGDMKNLRSLIEHYHANHVVTAILHKPRLLSATLLCNSRSR